MKKCLLTICLLCSFVLLAKADLNNTNFNSYKYTQFYPVYYTESNSFYVAPLVYTITANDEVTVSGADLDATEINIPDKISNAGKTYKVTSIHGYTFKYCNKLESLTIPSSVSYIYTVTTFDKTKFFASPFLGCKSLKTINDNALLGQGFWNSDVKGCNMLCEIAKGVTINTPIASDYTAWAPYVDGLGLNISISNSGFGSFFINKDLQIPENGVTVYIMKEVSGTATFIPLTNGYVPANTPVLIKGTAGSNVTFRTTTIPAGTEIDVTGNLLLGSLVNQTADANGEYFVLNKAQVSKTGMALFNPITSGSVVPKNEVYLPQSAAQLLENSGVTTGILTTVKEKAQNGTIYDLNGRKVNKAGKGIYIQNGKKEQMR